MSGENEVDEFIENMMKMVTYEERKVLNAPIWVIESMMPVEEFNQLPMKVKYLLICQTEELNAFHAQIDKIREHLDRTPL
jgi:uncharacterized cysteine cluster protein YcgN (CxxCxxCC family)